jgi:hypothetical protein
MVAACEENCVDAVRWLVGAGVDPTVAVEQWHGDVR